MQGGLRRPQYGLKALDRRARGVAHDASTSALAMLDHPRRPEGYSSCGARRLRGQASLDRDRAIIARLLGARQAASKTIILGVLDPLRPDGRGARNGGGAHPGARTWRPSASWVRPIAAQIPRGEVASKVQAMVEGAKMVRAELPRAQPVAARPRNGDAGCAAD